MPLLYGEGRQKAFLRLQEAIYNSTTDHSLFLFRYSLHRNDQPLLADSPTRFCERAACKQCPGHFREQIIKNTLYNEILASERLSTQAHEQILTTVTPSQNKMSTTLPLLKYEEVSSQLVFLDNMSYRPWATHVAVLNHTLKKNPGGALCLLLCQDGSGEVFRRDKYSLGLLPTIEKLAPKIQKRGVVICPGPSSKSEMGSFKSRFAVGGDFLEQDWACTGQDFHKGQVFVEGNFKPYFEIWTARNLRSSLPVSPAEVACQAGDPRDASVAVLLQLINFGDDWSIKEIFELFPSKGSWGRRSLYLSSVVVDRCSIQLTSGKRLSVGLRRLPAGCRPAFPVSVWYSYQIVLKYV